MNTKPLEKSFLTGEGILVYATNVVLAIAAVLPQGLSWTHTALYAGILNAVHVVSRTALKVVAVQQGLGVPAPPTVDPVDPAVIASVIQEAFGDKPPVGASVIPAGTPAAAAPTVIPEPGQEPRGAEVQPQGS